MPQPAPLPDDLASGPFDRRAAERAGLRQGRLRRADVRRPYRGVQTLHTPQTVLDRCSAYAVRLKPGQAFSHATAAQLLDLPLPQALENETQLHVCAVMPAPAPTTRGVVGHRLRVRPPLGAVHGLPVVRADEVWAQLATELGLDDLVVLGDAILQAYSDVHGVLDALRGAADVPYRAGAARLRRAVVEMRAGSASPGETRVRLLLVRAGVPEPTLNAPVTRADGFVLGHGDLVWAARRVVLEYEGDHHRVDREQFRYDIDRYERFQEAGWTVLRVTADDLAAPRSAALVRRVRSLVG